MESIYKLFYKLFINFQMSCILLDLIKCYSGYMIKVLRDYNNKKHFLRNFIKLNMYKANENDNGGFFHLKSYNFLMKILKFILHLQCLQNTGYIPHAVQYILVDSYIQHFVPPTPHPYMSSFSLPMDNH